MEATTASTGLPGRRAEIRSIEPGQRRREAALLRLYARTRSARAREDLIRSFIPLARSLAMRYRGGAESFEDLVQVASLGLVKAIDGFDPERGKPFTAYAVPTILGELRRHFRDHVWDIHLPRSLQERTLSVDNAVNKLTEELGRFPTVAQIAVRLELTHEQVLEALRAGDARRTLSRDAPGMRDDEESVATIETIGDQEIGYDRVEAGQAALDAGLDERDWLVLRLRFAEHMNQYEIGRRLGISQMQVSRIMRRALRKLLTAVRGGEEILSV